MVEDLDFFERIPIVEEKSVKKEHLVAYFEQRTLEEDSGGREDQTMFSNFISKVRFELIAKDKVNR